MTGTKPPASDNTAENILYWLRVNARYLGIGAGVVVVAAAGYWFYTSSMTRKEQNADLQLSRAKQSLAVNNLPLAQADLNRVVTRYANTRSGVEAAELLAQLYYDQKQYQKGIDVLQKAAGEGIADATEAALHGLIADGYAQMGKLAEAAKEYQKAADVARYPGERNYNLAKAARTLASADQDSAAVALWRKLAADPDASAALVAEAQVRLGELTAKAAGKS